MEVSGGAHLTGVAGLGGGGGVGSGGGGGGGGGGPAPFLVKTYDMVEDPVTDAVVSWSDATDASFVVWNPPEFAARLLPTYFKHNNFSSFIRQLNTYVRYHSFLLFPLSVVAAGIWRQVVILGCYFGVKSRRLENGFRKIDPERWEFANEHFVKGQKHLLKNIHRRKPIHSHSHQPGALPDNERAMFQDEIDQLQREKIALQADLWKFKQQQSGAMIQIEDLERRVLNMEQRQLRMAAFLQQAGKNPHFVNKLVKMAEASSAFADAFHKKRRFPGVDYCNETTETGFYDDHSSTSKPEIGNLLNQHFCDKLQLGLCPTMAESNLITLSTHSSHEDNGSPHGKHPECERMGMECLPLVPQMMELSDTGTSICPSKSDCFAPAVNDEGLLPCHLSLTLASCPMDMDRSQISNANRSTIDQGRDNPIEVTTAAMEKDDDLGRHLADNQKASGDPRTADVTTSQGGDAQVATETPAAPPAVVNDKFWEQFLTERPGCSDTEEASSSRQRDPSREQMEDNHKQAYGDTRSDRKDMEQLTL